MRYFAFLRNSVVWCVLLMVAAGVAAYLALAARQSEPEQTGPERPTKMVFRAPWKEVPPNLKLTFSPDGSLLVATLPNYDPFSRGSVQFISRAHTSCVFAVDNGECRLLLPPAETEGECAFSTRGDRFAIYSRDALDVFDSRTGKRLANLKAKIDKPLLGVCFDAKDRLLGVGSLMSAEPGGPGGVIIREIFTDQVRLRLTGKRRWPGGVFGHFFTILSEDGQDQEIWDIITGTLVVGPNRDNQYTPMAVNKGICCLRGDAMDFYDLSAGRKYSVVLHQTGAATEWPASKDCIAVRVQEDKPSPVGGRGLPTRVQFPGVKFYDVTTGEEIGYLPDALRATVSYDRRKLAFAKGQTEIELWELPQQKVPAAVAPLWAIVAGISALLAVVVVLCRMWGVFSR
jgi:hypothetical protein